MVLEFFFLDIRVLEEVCLNLLLVSNSPDFTVSQQILVL